MQQFKGNAIVDGVATGTVFFYTREAQNVTRRNVADTAAEYERYLWAKDAARQELSRLYEKALKEAGKENAAIFEAQQLFLEDEGYDASVAALIREENVCA